MTEQYKTFRERDRQKYHAVGGSYARAEKEKRMTNQPAMAPIRRPRRVKVQPHPGIQCRVKDSQGNYYDFMGKDSGNYLFLNDVRPEGHTFPSRAKATSAVWHTIERMKYETGSLWDGKEFVLENVR